MLWKCSVWSLLQKFIYTLEQISLIIWRFLNLLLDVAYLSSIDQCVYNVSVFSIYPCVSQGLFVSICDHLSLSHLSLLIIFIQDGQYVQWLHIFSMVHVYQWVWTSWCYKYPQVHQHSHAVAVINQRLPDQLQTHWYGLTWVFFWIGFLSLDFEVLICWAYVWHKLPMVIIFRYSNTYSIAGCQ